MYTKELESLLLTNYIATLVHYLDTRTEYIARSAFPDGFFNIALQSLWQCLASYNKAAIVWSCTQSSMTVIRQPALSCSVVWGDHWQLLWHTTGSIVLCHIWKRLWKTSKFNSRYLYDCLLVAIALLCFSCKSYVVNIRHIEYFKLVFLKYINVPTWSIFAGLVTTSTITFVLCILCHLFCHKKLVLFKYRMIAEWILAPDCMAPSTLA